MTIYTFYIDSRPEFGTHVPCFSGDPVRWCTGALLVALEFAESAQVHSNSSKWCRLAPHSPEGAGRTQAPQKVQSGPRCSPEGVGRCCSPQMV